MEIVNLGKTGLKVTRLCLGMMSFGSDQWRPYTLNEDASRPMIRYAIEQGINFFDTADVYSNGISEEITGRAIRDYARRDEVVIATKVFSPLSDPPIPNRHGLSRKWIMTAIDDSLRRLGTDYVDIYQIHRWDYSTPIEETMEALDEVVKAGKARYIGASSMFTWQFGKANFIAAQNGWTRFVVMQNHYNLIYREEEREMIPYCIDQGIGIIPWSPLARGFLAGNRTRDNWGETVRAQKDKYAQTMYYRENDFQVLDRVVKLAEQLGKKPAQVALAWMLHRPGITAPIIGASKLSHLEDALGALEIKLSAEDMTYLEEVYEPHPILGHS